MKFALNLTANVCLNCFKYARQMNVRSGQVAKEFYIY